ncbi:UPF0262 family protein [Thalassobaculum sp.]|uniref:UPF0262 family protein n=1 Tax=Thalassobaculum sp. TaxID=2022740 RepID=UPI0032EF4C98
MSDDDADTAPLDPTGDDARIVHISLDERTVIRRSAEVEQERAIAVYDLLEDNRFRPRDGGPGPYHLRLFIEENRLVFDVRDTADAPRTQIALHLAPFRRVVKDYFQICESYYDAIKRLTPSQIEAIDMGRRGLHNEGSQMLRDRLDGRIAIDHDTSRRLFTLLCVLHIRG